MVVQSFTFTGSARLIRKTILQVLIGLMGGGVAVLAQQAPPVGAAASAPADSAASAPALAAQTASPTDQPASASETAAAKAGYYTKDKKGHLLYTGPNTLVELAPTPMIDGEGKQRVDPDGKLMFNPPVKQIRDKKGHPEFDEKGAPVFETATNLGYTEKGKKIEPKKVKPPKMTPVSISAGTLTVDGWTGKARLNYDIADLKFIYIYAPGVGTTIVSQNPFPGAKETPQAFNGKTLSITVDGHPIQLYSEKLLLGKKPVAAWVVVDRGFQLPSKFPVFGYGATTKSPYTWPGAKASVASNGVMQPPPLPNDVRPTLLLAPCPAGMMRQAGPPVLPGQKAPEQPCVPINAPAASAATPPSVPAARQN
jgi:hypothetical protein